MRAIRIAETLLEILVLIGGRLVLLSYLERIPGNVIGSLVGKSDFLLLLKF